MNARSIFNVEQRVTSADSDTDALFIDWNDENGYLTCDIFYYDESTSSWTVADTEQTAPWSENVTSTQYRVYMLKTSDD